MNELMVLGFDSRKEAEDARSRGAELARAGMPDLTGAALVYRDGDGRVRFIQPKRLLHDDAAAKVAAGGGILRLALPPAIVLAAVGAGAEAVGAPLSALGFDLRFLRQVKEALEPGRAALLLVLEDDTGPTRVVDSLRPLPPRIMRKALDPAGERRFLIAVTDDASLAEPGIRSGLPPDELDVRPAMPPAASD